ncbi:MAG: prolyl oligopeptidase family serine peptidase [Magnetococcales bacterium]|nr:prolyl oligopeptidase family serine peptidase [Magnetococcales bacterium]
MIDRIITAFQRTAMVILVAFCCAYTPVLFANETVLTIPAPNKTRSGTETVELVATLFKPEGPGPFPLAIVSHGSPRGGDNERKGQKRPVFRALSKALVDMGYVVLLPQRRGYGESGGHWAEGYGKCGAARYHAAGLEGASDLSAAIRHARQQTFVRPDQVVLIGTSAGGFASIAAGSMGLEGVRGIINVAGGRGSIRPGFVCSQETLVSSLSDYGKTSHVPSLWIYAKNDRFFHPDLVQAMHTAYRQQGGKAELVMIPPVGEDGHSLMKDDNVPYILPHIQDFLHTINPVKP